jgi:hypothetical protein
MFARLLIVLQAANTLAAVASPPQLHSLSGRDVAPTCIPGTSECFKIVDASEFTGCPNGWRSESNLVNGAGNTVPDKCVGTCSLEEEAKCLSRDCKSANDVCQKAPKSSLHCMTALEKCSGPVRMDKSVCTDSNVVDYFLHITGGTAGELCSACATYSEGLCTLHMDLVEKAKKKFRDSFFKGFGISNLVLEG